MIKLSDLSTRRAASVLCELTPPVSNIATDKELVNVVGKMIKAVGEDGERLNIYGSALMLLERISDIIPLLLNTHFADLCDILSIFTEKTVEEIMEQNVIETMNEAREIFSDKELVNFFKSFSRRTANA